MSICGNCDGKGEVFAMDNNYQRIDCEDCKGTGEVFEMNKPLVLETHNDTGIEWGVSIDGPNPTADKYFGAKDAETAKRLAVYLSELTP